MGDKHLILREISRLASRQNGKPPSLRTFTKETGIKQSQWYPSIWLRWNDAIAEAGFDTNEFHTNRYEDVVLLDLYSRLIREIGHVPVIGEIRRKAKSDPTFPSENAFDRFETKVGLVNAAVSFCSDKPEFSDVLMICEEYLSSTIKKTHSQTEKERLIRFGYVYLMKSGKHYKIGRTNAIGRREWELGIKLPIPPKTIHVIETDDPVGVEAYWHKRFAEKRGEGEWFILTAEDVATFKRWKMIL